MTTGTKHRNSVDSMVIARIRARGRGKVYTPADFADLGSSAAVRIALMRYHRGGILRRLAHGLYEFPRLHRRLGALAPSPEAVVKALQTRDACRVRPTGAYAANLLGLSDQVPARIVFETDGAPRRLRIGRQEIVLRKRSARSMATAGRVSGLIVSALEHLGRDAVDDRTIAALRRRFDAGTLRTAAKDARHAPDWIAGILRRLATEAGND